MKELYDKYKGRTAISYDMGAKSEGVVCGYSDKYLIIEVKSGASGWCIDHKRPFDVIFESKTSLKGYLYVTEEDVCSSTK